MHVVCLFPIVGYEKNIPKILEFFRKHICPKLSVLGATNLGIKFPTPDYVFVPTAGVLKGKPKGEGILEALKNVAAPPDYVIVCDGSGKIPYSKIIDIFRELVSDSTVNCVMAERQGNKAISNIRFLIERWEIFSLKRFFRHEKDIPDGQCGLWGYHAKHVCFSNGEKARISLTAKGYDIELDLLSEVLQKNIEYSFIPVELPLQPTNTNFTFEDNLRKMDFILGKYPRLKDCLLKYLSEFNKKEAVQDISTLDADDKGIWKDYCGALEELVNRR